MIILGIDPGSRFTGYGLIRKQGPKITHIENGVIDTSKISPFEQRLTTIFDKIQEIIHQFKPVVLAIENIFYAKNVQSTVKLGHARGVILVAASKLAIPAFEYTPLEVKQAIVGYGRASKEQIQKMVKAHLNLPQIAEENASDALAVALCHAQTERMNRMIKTYYINGLQ